MVRGAISSVIEALQTGLRARIVPLDAIAALVPDGGIVLDLGCGQGLLARQIAGRVERVVGVDFDPRKCQMGRELLGGLKNVELVVDDLIAFLERTPAPRARTVLLSDTLSSFIADEVQDRVLLLATRALEPGGTIVLKFIDTEPRWKVTLSRLLSSVIYRVLRLSRSEGQRFRYRSRRVYRTLLEQSGLRVTEHLLHRRLHHPVPHVVLVAQRPDGSTGTAALIEIN